MAVSREYDDRMNKRITVSLPEHLVAEATQAAASGRASSVSAYVAEALAEKSGRGSLDEFLADWRREVGPPTSEETAWAQRALGLSE